MVIEKQPVALMTVREVAELLNIHNNTVRRWSDQGIIKTYRISRRGDRRFKKEDILSFLSECNRELLSQEK